MSGNGSGTVETTPRFAVDDLPPMRSRRRWTREAWVGALVVVGVVAGLLALLSLTDPGDFRGRTFVNTTVHDAGGLRKGDPVQMRGVTIGRVQRFEMVPEGVRIRMELENDYQVPRDSRVALGSSGLLGGRVVEIVPGASPIDVESGAELPGSATAGGDIMATAGAVGERADATLRRVQMMLSPDNVDAVSASAQQLRSMTADLAALAADQRAQLASLTASLRRSAAGIEDATAGPELRRTVGRLDTLSARLAASASSLERASGSLEVVLGRMERGEGTLGRLSADDALYQNLNEASADLSALLEDVRRNPDRYFKVSVF